MQFLANSLKRDFKLKANFMSKQFSVQLYYLCIFGVRHFFRRWINVHYNYILWLFSRQIKYTNIGENAWL